MSALPRVLLVNPRITSRRSARFPLSLLQLAAALEGRYACRIVDGNVEGGYLQRIGQLLRDERYAAVGVTVMGGPQVQSGIDVSNVIRQASPGTPIIWGGYFATLYPDTALNASYVDYAVRGSGETTLIELLDALRSGEDTAIAAVRGVAFKRGGAVVRNPERPFAVQPQPPLPYDLLGDPRSYLARTFLGRRTAAHQASVGCRTTITPWLRSMSTDLSPSARASRSPSV